MTNNIRNDSSNRNKLSSNQQSITPNRDISYLPQSDQMLMTNDIRLISLESRVETLEKMVYFYEELLKLKEEEKKNYSQLDTHKITDLSSKVSQLECNVSSLNKKLNDQYDFLIEKIGSLQEEREIEEEEEGIKRLDIDEINDNRPGNKVSKEDQMIKSPSNFNNSSISDLKSNEYIINRIEELEDNIKKNQMINNELNNNKLFCLQTQFDNKIADILSVIHDLNKITENNEYTVSKLKESIQIIQNGNGEVMKIISNQTERKKQIDYILEQINDLKSKYTQILLLVKSNIRKYYD